MSEIVRRAAAILRAEEAANAAVVGEVVIRDLTGRMEAGRITYGTYLRPFNGRDALQDAYEEALDLACYLRQAMLERDGVELTLRPQAGPVVEP